MSDNNPPADHLDWKFALAGLPVSEINMGGTYTQIANPASSGIKCDPGSNFTFSCFCSDGAIGRFRLDVKSSATGDNVDVLYRAGRDHCFQHAFIH